MSLRLGKRTKAILDLQFLMVSRERTVRIPPSSGIGRFIQNQLANEVRTMLLTHQNTFTTSTSQLMLNSINITQSTDEKLRLTPPPRNNQEDVPRIFSRSWVLAGIINFSATLPFQTPVHLCLQFISHGCGTRSLPCHPTLLWKRKLRPGATSGRAAAVIHKAKSRA